MKFKNQEEMMVWTMIMAAAMGQFALTPPPGTQPAPHAASLADAGVLEYRKRGVEPRNHDE